MILEVCANSYQSAINAEKAGMLQQGEDVIVLDVENMT